MWNIAINLFVLLDSKYSSQELCIVNRNLTPKKLKKMQFIMILSYCNMISDIHSQKTLTLALDIVCFDKIKIYHIIFMCVCVWHLHTRGTLIGDETNAQKCIPLAKSIKLYSSFNTTHFQSIPKITFKWNTSVSLLSLLHINV